MNVLFICYDGSKYRIVSSNVTQYGGLFGGDCSARERGQFSGFFSAMESDLRAI